MIFCILLGWEREGMDSLCLRWQEHSTFYACLCVCVCAFKIGWEFSNSVVLQRNMGNVVYSCCFATAVHWPDGRRERDREPVSDPRLPHTPFSCAEECFLQSLLMNFYASQRTFSGCLRAWSEPLRDESALYAEPLRTGSFPQSWDACSLCLRTDWLLQRG